MASSDNKQKTSLIIDFSRSQFFQYPAFDHIDMLLNKHLTKSQEPNRTRPYPQELFSLKFVKNSLTKLIEGFKNPYMVSITKNRVYFNF